MKSVVLYIAHKYTNSNMVAFNRLLSELDATIYDLYWCAPFDVELPNNIQNIYRYDNFFVVNHSGFVNPSYIVEKFYDEHKNYKYYYVHEYDVAYTKNYGDLMVKLDTTDNADLICAFVCKKTDKDWYWWCQESLAQQLFNKKIEVLSSCLSFARLSNIALNYITNVPFTVRNELIYELSWPTICYNNGLKISTLDEQSNNEFIGKYKLCNDNWYHFQCIINDTNRNSYSFEPERLYTKYEY